MTRKETRIQHSPLEMITKRLEEALHCEQEDLWRTVIQHVACGKPVTKVYLQVLIAHAMRNEV